MKSDLLKYIEEKIPSLSKGQRLIANYIIEHYDKVAFMTAAKLGKTVGTSESTVVRFAYEIGFDGYPELQFAIQEMIRNKLTYNQRMEVAKQRIDKDDILGSVLNLDIEKIRLTIAQTSREDFNAAVDSIINARRIYIFGARSSAPLASFLCFYYRLIFDDIYHINANSEAEIFEQMIKINNEDVLILMSFPRYSRRAQMALQFSLDRGAKVVSITDSASSPIAKNTSHLLLARSEMASFVDSLVAPLSLVNALIVATAMKKEKDIKEAFTKLEQLWDEYGVY